MVNAAITDPEMPDPHAKRTGVACVIGTNFEHLYAMAMLELIFPYGGPATNCTGL